jgi:hypothetical protein
MIIVKLEVTVEARDNDDVASIAGSLQKAGEVLDLAMGDRPYDSVISVIIKNVSEDA